MSDNRLIRFMTKFTYSVALTLLFSLSSQTVTALPIANPSPPFLADDIDGTGYFDHDDAVFALEITDIGEVPGTPFSPNRFGFYFQGADISDSSNLFTIFDVDDEVNNEAIISFEINAVLDLEEDAVETLFIGEGFIGFFLELGIGDGLTLYSDALLNFDQVDYFGTFPLLADPSIYALVFNYLDTAVSINISSGLEPVSTSVSVDEPRLVFLLMFGIVGLLYNRTGSSNRFKRRSSCSSCYS